MDGERRLEVGESADAPWDDLPDVHVICYKYLNRSERAALCISNLLVE